MLSTPDRKRRQVRELYLPEITKGHQINRKEIDLTTLYEDPFFDLHKKKPRRGFGRGKGSVDQRVQFGSVPGELPPDAAPQTAAPSATTAPSIGGLPPASKNVENQV